MLSLGPETALTIRHEVHKAGGKLADLWPLSAWEVTLPLLRKWGHYAPEDVQASTPLSFIFKTDLETSL